ncbi:MAG: hypothetical protein ABJG47_03300 [Ekhidna sp.]
MKLNLTAILIVILVGCNSATNDSKQAEAPKKKASPPAAKVQQQPGPTYESFYFPDSVELETIAYSGEIDQETALQIVVNSHKKVKADFLNYMMEAYKTITPASSQLEPMFDAEHIGKFIVWQYAKEDTECFPAIFEALNIVFEQSDEDAYTLAKYGIYQMMIYESKRLDVNYNGDFNPWLVGTTNKEWFELIDEMESGRS